MKRIFPVLFFVLIHAGCQEDKEDKIAPTIDSYTLNGKSFAPGDLLEVGVNVSDNENLGQLRLRVQQAFNKNFGAWAELRIIRLEGLADSYTYSLTLPDSALAGYYVVFVQISDLRGNGSKDSSRFFNVLQPGLAPVLENFDTQPALFDSLLMLSATDTLTFQGMATDDEALASFRVDILNSNDFTILSSNTTFPDTIITSWNIASADTIFPDYGEDEIPSLMRVRLTDTTGHQTRVAFPVEFSP
jgi:hypothetical protein